MGLVEQLKGQKVCIDTAPIIYFIEKHHTYYSLLHPLFAGINSGDIKAFTSTVSLLEVLVLPFKTNNNELAEQYRNILLYSKNFSVFELSNEISERAARLRAKYDIRTPDAIQIATGIHHGANAFLTNDANLRKVIDINILILDDFCK